MVPQGQKGLSRFFGIIGETPGRRDRRNPIDGREVRGRDRHRSAEAIADERRRLVHLADKGKQKSFYVIADIEIAAVARRSPVKEQAPSSYLRDRSGKRHVLVQVQHVRRIDQRRDQNGGRAIATEVVKPRGADTRCNRSRRTRAQPWGPLIFRQAQKCRACRLRIVLPDRSYHFEKQRKRPRRTAMLRCTLIRE